MSPTDLLNSPIPLERRSSSRQKEDAERALKLYQSGLTKDQQNYVSTGQNKDGTFSLKVDEKAGKAADKESPLGRLYKAASADPVAVVSFVKKGDNYSYSVVTPDGRTITGQTSLGKNDLAGLTLLPVESREKAIPIAFAPLSYSTDPKKTQLVIATDPSAMTPTQAIYAETLVHFGNSLEQEMQQRLHTAFQA